MTKSRNLPWATERYRAKNELRKQCRANNPHAYREGRRNRRAYTVNGAFGNIANREIYGFCIIGTSLNW